MKLGAPIPTSAAGTMHQRPRLAAGTACTVDETPHVVANF